MTLWGTCFGNLISTKHIITAASCVLDRMAMKKSKKKIKHYIEEMRIAQVSFIKELKIYKVKIYSLNYSGDKRGIPRQIDL